MLRRLLRRTPWLLGLHQHGATAPPALRERGLQTGHLVIPMLMVGLLCECKLGMLLSGHGDGPRPSLLNGRASLKRSGGAAISSKFSRWLVHSRDVRAWRLPQRMHR